MYPVESLSMTGYLLVYEARNAPLLDWPTVAACVLMTAAWAVFWAVARKRWSKPGAGEHLPRVIDVIGVAGLVLIPAIGMIDAALAHHQNRMLTRALENGTYTLVEGAVQDFVPGDRGAHRDERWTVESGGQVYTYAYRSSFIVPGFHRSAGPIRQGLRVRIADVRGYIARLEIEAGAANQ